MQLCGFAPWRGTILVTISLGIALVAICVRAESVAVDVVLKDLHRPCGIAVRPGGTADRYEVFVAESGAGRVVRWSNQTPGQAAAAITGFDVNSGDEPMGLAGPAMLLFLDPGLLVVGTAADASGSALRGYELPEGETVLAADQPSEAASGEHPSQAPDGLVCLAATRTRANAFVPDMLVAVAGGGRLFKARVQAGMIGAPQPFGPAEAPHAPRAVATSNSGRIVVADTGGGLTFYNPIDGAAELALATDLKEIAGLAYSPMTGSLYAADFAGGIHRIDDESEPGQPACRTVKVADVERPAALAFAPDGALYVVTFGTGESDGMLAVLTGNL